MAYDPGYGPPQRSHNGPAAQRPPPPRGYGSVPPPPQQYEDHRQYDHYDDGYDYGGYGGGPVQDYGGQYQDQGYSQRPPRQDYPAAPRGRGGRPMPAGRGGAPPPPGHRGMAPRPRQGPPHGPDPGMGGRRPGPYSASSDPSSSRRPMNSPPVSPREPGFGGGAYPQYPGSQRGEQRMADQMAGMDLNGQGSRMGPNGRASSESQRAQGDYGRRPAHDGRGPHRGYPQQGYGDPRGAPPPQLPSGYDQGYGPPRDDFAPPGRSMTMPNNDSGHRQNMPPPDRMDAMPYNGSAGKAMPPRPSTATGSRPPPQTQHPQDPYSRHYSDGQDYQQDAYDDVYDSYYDNEPTRNGRGNVHHAANPSMPNFDAIPQQEGRGSFEQTMRPAQEQPQQGAHQTATLNHAKSQPNLRQPQAAVFEMAGDIPSVPAIPQANSFTGDYDRGYSSPNGYEQMPPRGPSAPPASQNGPGPGPPGMRSGPPPSRPGPGPGVPPSRSADGLPSHPTPVRPGLMANSMVNMNNKPPPVRNYGGVPQGGPPQPQPQQRQQAPPLQQRQQQPMPSQNGQAPLRDEEPPVTSQELEQLRMVIKNDPNDQGSALRLAKKLIEAADVLVPNLPDPKARGRARERYVLDAHKILKKLANAQNSEAMFLFADSLGKGLFGNEPDSKEAFTLYQSAAKLGHAGSAYRTAVCCEIGNDEGGGTRKDPMKAMQWYKRAATLGDPPAMYKLGMILLKGLLGQPRNPREAVGWLKRAAERADEENPHALHELGLLYESAQPNDAIIRDERYAFTLFQQAADLGYKFSQYRLGCAYEYGLMGCPIEPRLSIMWYSKAATQEEHQSELSLSGWYLTGSEGVLKQNDTEAYLWARKAAVAGLAKAEYAMGYFTEVGIGVPVNLEDAKRWYWRAAAQDFPKARDRLEDLKRVGKNSGPRQRERISRSRIEKQQEGECSIM